MGVYKILEIGVRPSQLLGIENDEYTSFCFDEACAFIIQQLKDGKEPIFRKDTSGSFTYKRPSDLYNKYK